MIIIENARRYRGEGFYIGRTHPRFGQGNPLGNPFRLAKDTPPERAKVLIRYKRWLRKQWLNADSPAHAELLRLAGIYRHTGELRLICWCMPKTCHGEAVSQAVQELIGGTNATGFEALTAPARLLITGSRGATPAMLEYARKTVSRARDREWEMIVGDAPGIDAAAIEACDDLGVPVTVCGAYGKLRRKSRSGCNLALGSSRYPYKLRDIWMAAHCDVCLAIWDGRSQGTRKTFEAARAMGKTVFVRTPKS